MTATMSVIQLTQTARLCSQDKKNSAETEAELPCGPAWVILFLSTSDGPATALHQQAAVASAAVVFFVGFVWRPFLGEGFAYSSAVDHGQIRSLVEPESGCLLRSKFQSHHATDGVVAFPLPILPIQLPSPWGYVGVGIQPTNSRSTPDLAQT